MEARLALLRLRRSPLRDSETTLVEVSQAAIAHGRVMGFQEALHMLEPDAAPYHMGLIDDLIEQLRTLGSGLGLSSPLWPDRRRYPSVLPKGTGDRRHQERRRSVVLRNALQDLITVGLIQPTDVLSGRGFRVTVGG